MAAEAFQFTPEPVGLFVFLRMATGQFTHRNIGTNNRACEHGHKVRQRNLCTVSVAGGVIDKERVALLFEHQNHLARGHLGQRGPERINGRCDLFDLRHQTRIRQRPRDPSRSDRIAISGDDFFQQVSADHIDAQKPRVGRGQIGASAGFGGKAVFVMRFRRGSGLFCLRFVSRGQAGHLTATGGIDIKGQYWAGHIRSPSTRVPWIAAIRSSTLAMSY